MNRKVYFLIIFFFSIVFSANAATKTRRLTFPAGTEELSSPAQGAPAVSWAKGLAVNVSGDIPANATLTNVQYSIEIDGNPRTDFSARLSNALDYNNATLSHVIRYAGDNTRDLDMQGATTVFNGINAQSILFFQVWDNGTTGGVSDIKHIELTLHYTTATGADLTRGAHKLIQKRSGQADIEHLNNTSTNTGSPIQGNITDDFEFFVPVKNTGTANSVNGKLYYYASQDLATLFNSANKITTEDSYGNLSPNGVSNETYKWDSTGRNPGTWYLGYVIDAQNSTPNELDEGNNQFHWTLNLVTPPPYLDGTLADTTIIKGANKTLQGTVIKGSGDKIRKVYFKIKNNTTNVTDSSTYSVNLDSSSYWIGNLPLNTTNPPLNTIGTYTLDVWAETNAYPAGLNLKTIQVSVILPPPTITTVNPTTLTRGDTNKTLTITGTNFTTGRDYLVYAGAGVVFPNPDAQGRQLATRVNDTTITVPVSSVIIDTPLGFRDVKVRYGVPANEVITKVNGLEIIEGANALGFDVSQLDGKSLRGVIFFAGGLADRTSAASGYKRVILREGATNIAFVHIGGLKNNLGLQNRRWRDYNTGAPVYTWNQIIPDSSAHTYKLVGVLDDDSEVESAPFTVTKQSALGGTITHNDHFPRYRNDTDVNFTTTTSGTSGTVNYLWYHNDLAVPFDNDNDATTTRKIETYGLNLVTLVVSNSGNNNVTFIQKELPVARHTRRGYPSSTDRSYAGVNVRTGNFFSETTDLYMPSKGLPFLFKRFYNSDDHEWSFSYTDKIVRNGVGNTGRMIKIQKADGRNCDYFHSNTGEWFPLNPGNYQKLVENHTSGNFTLYSQGELFYAFEGATKFERDAGTRHLTTVHDRFNNVTSINQSNGKITNITDSAGRLYNFDYVTVGPKDQIQKVTDPSGRYVQYYWDGVDETLTSVKNVREKTTHFGYTTGSSKRLKSILQPEGNTPLQLTYVSNKVATLRDGNLKTTTFTYNHASTPATTVVTPPITSNAFTYTFKSDGNEDFEAPGILNASVEKITNGESEEITATFKAPNELGNNNGALPDLGLQKQVNNRNGDTSTLSYQALTGNVTSVTRPIGNGQSDATSTYGWLSIATGENTNLQQLISYISPQARSHTYEYVPDDGTDGYGKLKSVTNALLEKTQYTYFDSGLTKTVTDPRNNTHHFEYNNLFGLPSKITDPYGDTEEFSYDAYGFLLTYTNKLGRITTYSHDKAGNRVSVTDPAPFEAQTATWTWDDNGRLEKHTDRRGFEWKQEYDNANNLVKTIDPTLAEIEFVYDDMNRLQKQIDQRDHKTQFTFDKNSRVETRINHLMGTLTYEYDKRDNVTKITDESGKYIVITYDKLDRQIKVIDQLGNYTENAYDKDGLRISFRDKEGKITFYEYDDAGRLESVTDPENGAAHKTTIQRDANGNITRIIDANGNPRDYEWDKLNRRTQLKDAENREWKWEYNAIGNITKEDKPSTKDIVHIYDELNRLIRTNWSDGTNTQRTYDANNNELTCIDPIGTTTKTYTSRNELVTTTDPYGQTVANRYDLAGNRDRITYPGNKIVNYAFDEINRIETITPWTGGATGYEYFANSLLKKQTNGNGSTTDWNYDDANRLISLLNKKSNGTVLTGYTYTLDKVGNIKDHPTNTNPVLKPLPKPFDASFDDSNRITSDGQNTFTHDVDGRLTNGTLGANAVTYAQNDLDLITAITPSAGGQSFSAGYNGNGHRLFKTQDGTTTRFVLDQATPLTQVLVENDDNNQAQNYYIHGHGLVQQIDASDNRSYFYHFDHVGSTTAMTDSSQNIIAGYNYAAYGRTKASTAHYNPFRYVGRWGIMDDNNGLHHMRARYYDQRTSRFLSQDSVLGVATSPQTLGRYAYGLGNPYSNIDPSGATANGVGFWQKSDMFFDSLGEASYDFFVDSSVRLYKFTAQQTYDEGALVGFSSGVGMGFGTVGFAEGLSGYDIDINKDGSYSVRDASSFWQRTGNFVEFGLAVAPSVKLASPIAKGGPSFTQFKYRFWKNKIKDKLPDIVGPNGQRMKQFYELHHKYIPQRWKRAPNWLKNNRFNLEVIKTIEHARKDKFRAKFLPQWVKDLNDL